MHSCERMHVLCDRIKELSPSKVLSSPPLLQCSNFQFYFSWHDCYTCNLRTRCGICSVCVETCHKGHKISAPKFSRYTISKPLPHKSFTFSIYSIYSLKILLRLRTWPADQGSEMQSDQRYDSIRPRKETRER